MVTPSNLYAEKAFSEHPVALWALDDQLDYVSLISEAQREIESPAWTIVNATAILEDSIVRSPFPYSVTNKITASSTSVEITSPVLFNSDNISSWLSSVSFTINILDQDDDIESVELGYFDGTIEHVSEFFITEQDVWKNLTSTFPSIDADTDVSLFIRVNFAAGSTSSVFFINGISVGQWSENFSSTSLGVELISVPDSIAIPSSLGVPSKAYASESNTGYYLVQDGALRAVNSGIPMVYGASNSTILRTGVGPGLIVPGKGFLNAIGQSSTLTFEAWLRVDANNAYQRILGPVSSEDGLYVEGPFLVFRVGDKTCSHFVGEWFRPMLVDLIVSATSATMLINGEYVASIDLSNSVPNYASPNNEVGQSQDWLGVYCFDGVTSIEVDCMAIYPYEVTEILAKKRFVSGQGVPYPQDVNVAYSGESLFIDYIYANYAKNYEYPATSSWLKGVYDNLDVSSKRLASPTYSLPSVSSSGGPEFTLAKLESDTPAEYAISLRSASDWADKNSYIYFDSMNILSKPISGIFGVFEKQTADTSTNRQTLIKLSNKLTQDYVLISLEDTDVKYSYKQSGQEEVFIDYDNASQFYEITKDERFAIGISVESLISSEPNLRQFFANRSNVSIQLLGDYSGVELSLDTTYTGLCHAIGFCTAKNMIEFNTLFSAAGILDATESDITGASYELVREDVAGIDKFEIKTRSYWEAHVPLSSLSKLTTDSNNETVDKIDFVQFNVDYPQTRPDSTSELDPRNDLVKSYISFQYVADGANKPLTDFQDLPTFNSQRIALVEPGTYLEDWTETRYQVVDGSIIYLPEFEGNDSYADIALCMHFEINARASLSNKTLTRFVKLGAQSLSDNSSIATEPINNVGTKFGKSLYPYTENVDGGFPANISFSAKNPFKIFRDSAPHLYLTHNSGISIVGEYDENVDRGVFARINRQATADTNISSMQMAMLWNDKLFPTSPQRIFEIDASTGVYKFYVEAVDPSRRRGQITVTLTSGTTETTTQNVFFYWNGNSVTNPVMTLGEWGMIGIVFKPFLIFSNSVGYLKITSPMIVNNVSTYQLEATAQAQQIVYKTWQDIEENVAEDEWDEWYDPGVVERTWEDAFYKVATFNPSINPSEIYKVYIGTNKIIADSPTQSGRIELNKYQYITYGDVQRDSYQVSLL